MDYSIPLPDYFSLTGDELVAAAQRALDERDWLLLERIASRGRFTLDAVGVDGGKATSATGAL
jgi:hypothetical protein